MRGHTEATIDKVKVGFQFGTNAFELLTEMHGKEFSDITEILKTPTGIRDLIFCAYRSDCLIRGEEEVFNKFKITNWLDYLDEPAYARILKAVESTRVLGSGLEIEQPKK
jgi:hypothetical protein